MRRVEIPADVKMLGWLLVALAFLLAMGYCVSASAAEPTSDIDDVAYGSADTTCNLTGANRGCQRFNWRARTGATGTPGKVLIVLPGGGWTRVCKDSNAAHGCTGEPQFNSIGTWLRDTAWDGTGGHPDTFTEHYAVAIADYRVNDPAAGGTRNHCDHISDDIRELMNFLHTTYGDTEFLIFGHSAGITIGAIALWGGNPYSSPSCGGVVNLDGAITVGGLCGTGFVGRESLLDNRDAILGDVDWCPTHPGSSKPKCRLHQMSGYQDSGNIADLNAADPWQLLDASDVHLRILHGADDGTADCTQTSCDANYSTVCDVGPQLQAAQPGVVTDSQCRAGASHNSVIQCPTDWVPTSGHCAVTAAFFGSALASFDPPIPPPSTPTDVLRGAYVLGAVVY